MDFIEFSLDQIVPETLTKLFKTVFHSQGREECTIKASTKSLGLNLVKSSSRTCGMRRVFLFLKYEDNLDAVNERGLLFTNATVV